jgi:ribonuclease-3
VSGARPAVASDPRTAELERRIGHRFAKPALLREALTHSSATRPGRRAPRSYERLEFLGDRVLGLMIADLLIRRFPDEGEGALSRRHAALVRKETLAEIGAELALGDWLVLGRSEEDSGGRSNPATLADALEALIGALHLDGGFDIAAAFVERHWLQRLEAMIAPPRDAKTTLQEWAQGRGLPLPDYRVVGASGPAHAPSFEVEVMLPGFAAVRAAGGSKRAAERSAAEQLLARLADAPQDADG